LTALGDILTAESLTTILGREVVAVDVSHEKRHYSAVARATVHFADGEPLSRRLFAKTAPRSSEVQFHTDLQPNLDPPAIACVHAAMRGDAGVLVFDDISETHREPDDRLSTDTYAAIIDVLGRFHARSLDATTEMERANRGFEFVISQARRALPAFFEAVDLSPSERATIETAVARWPEAHRARIASGRSLTLLHGDIHPGNVMLPVDVRGGAPIYFVDWSDWRAEPGPVDVSFLLLTMRRGQRKEAEAELVARWHAALEPHSPYTGEDAWTDYRIATVGSLLHPLHWWIGGSPERIWRGGLRARLAAVADLQALDTV
jgi:phosphotransferase family enzyme